MGLNGWDAILRLIKPNLAKTMAPLEAAAAVVVVVVPVVTKV
jgi:hypothetical protein